MKPAIVAALVYSFVRAMTAISAVIFLVSARYDLATTYIVGRVENNEYGIAVAYGTVLILVMLVVIACMQVLVGARRLGRRDTGGPGMSGMRTNMPPNAAIGGAG
jgi:iron(III) transport system permease protein